MKHTLNYIFLSLIILLFISCEKAITLDLPPYAPKIVINGELNTNNEIKLEISKSIDIMKDVDSTGYLLNDATARLFENNVYVGNLKYDQLYYTYKIKPIQGKIYKIEVSRSGLGTAVAEIKIPDYFETSSSYKDTVSFDKNGFPVGQLTIKFKDDVSTSNYYQLSIRTYSTGQQTWYPFLIESNDPVFINNVKLDDGSYVFSDATFNGQYKSIVLPVDDGVVSNSAGVDRFEISIKTFSDEYYNYLQQVRDYKQQSSTFETGPIILKSNVTNGLGMVGGVYNSKDTIR